MKDEVIAKGKWEFNEDVTKVFENMLSRSIPDYNTMRGLVNMLALKHIHEGSRILDIGCSNGLAVKDIVEQCDDSVSFTLCDVSEPMLEACRERYKDKSNVNVLYNDLRDSLPQGKYDVELSVLTIQFTPIEYRHEIVNRLYSSLNDKGVLIVVEKILGVNSAMDSLLVDCYYDMKKENQYTQEQIQNKRKSLEGVLVPVTSEWNEDIFRHAGFSTVQKFWQCLNFTGWIMVK